MGGGGGEGSVALCQSEDTRQVVMSLWTPVGPSPPPPPPKLSPWINTCDDYAVGDRVTTILVVFKAMYKNASENCSKYYV